MVKKIFRFSLVIGILIVLVLSSSKANLFAEPQKNPPKPLPQAFVWTSLSMGLSGHSTSVAMGEGIRKITGVPVQVIPDPTDLGGWLPVVTGKAQATFRATSTSGVHNAYV